MNLRIIAALLVALVIRLLGIISRPIWYDEAFAILFSEKGPGAMLYGTLAPAGAGSADIHPLGYYTLLWLWMRLFGESLVATRLLSVLAGLISVYLIYLIASEAFSDEKIALLSMLIAALAPFQVHYAQEIRMYSFLAMWLLLATYAYQRAVRTGGWRWWAVFAASAALAQYTHNLAGFYLVPLALSPLLRRDWKTFRALILAGLGALLLYLPWLIQLPAQFAKIQQAYWVERPDISKLFTLLLVFTTNTPLPRALIPAALAIALIVLAVGLLQTVGMVRRRDPGAGGALWVLYLSFGPPLLLFVFSQWRAVYIERALLASGAIYCIWLAWMFSKTDLSDVVRSSLAVLLFLAFVLGIHQHVTYRDFPYGPFEALDESLRRRGTPQDVIVHANKLSLLPAMYYDRALPQTFIGDPPGSGSDTLAPATQKVLGLRAEADIRAATKGSQRVWYIIYRRALTDTETEAHLGHPDIEYLNSQYILELEETWDGLEVYLFSRVP